MTTQDDDLDFDDLDFDDLNLSDEDLLQAERMDLVNEINAFILTLPDDTRMELMSPDTLTVKRMNGVYAKIAHVGGEGFKPLRSYVGKRGKLVMCFAPLEAAEYVEMEMYVNDCYVHLTDFGSVMQFPDGLSLETKLFKLGKKESQLREAARNKGKFDDYDSFGTF